MENESAQRPRKVDFNFSDRIKYLTSAGLPRAKPHSILLDDNPIETGLLKNEWRAGNKREEIVDGVWQEGDNIIKEVNMSDIPTKDEIKTLIASRPDWCKDFITDIEVDIDKCYSPIEKEILQANLEESQDEEYLAEIKELDDTLFDGINPTTQEILRDLEHIKNYTAYHGKVLERLQYLIFALMVLNIFSWLV